MTTNQNMLSPVGFSFQIKKTPDLNLFIQAVTLPGINLGSTDQPTPFKAIPIYGDHITFTELDITFKINEDLSDYKEIYDWIVGIGFPNNYDQFKALKNQPLWSGEGLESDATLTILSSAMNPIMKIELEDLFPISLTPITMDARDTNIEYLEATASFRFNNYTLNLV